MSEFTYLVWFKSANTKNANIGNVKNDEWLYTINVHCNWSGTVWRLIDMHIRTYYYVMTKKTKTWIAQSFLSILYEQFNDTCNSYILCCCCCLWAGKVLDVFIYLCNNRKRIVYARQAIYDMKTKTIKFKMQYKYSRVYSIYLYHIAPAIMYVYVCVCVCSVTLYIIFRFVMIAWRWRHDRNTLQRTG